MIDQLIIKIDPALTGKVTIDFPLMESIVLNRKYFDNLDNKTIFNAFALVKESETNRAGYIIEITLKEKNPHGVPVGIPNEIIESMEALKRAMDDNFSKPAKEYLFSPIKWHYGHNWDNNPLLYEQLKNQIINKILMTDDLSLSTERIFILDSDKLEYAFKVKSFHKDFTGTWEREAYIDLRAGIEIIVTPGFINRNTSGK